MSCYGTRSSQFGIPYSAFIRTSTTDTNSNSSLADNLNCVLWWSRYADLICGKIPGGLNCLRSKLFLLRQMAVVAATSTVSCYKCLQCGLQSDIWDIRLSAFRAIYGTSYYLHSVRYMGHKIVLFSAIYGTSDYLPSVRYMGHKIIWF